ncbi:hypothetical protein BGW39_003350, partial [Mortierella sp. 14UC]
MTTNKQLLHTQTAATQEKAALPPKHRAWITNNHSISFPAFVKHFQYYDQTTAKNDYQNILDGAKFTDSVRQKLRSDFKFFQDNSAKDFWVQRLRVRNTRIVITKTSVALQDAGAKEAQRNLENYSAARDRQQAFEDSGDHGNDSDGHDNTDTNEMATERHKAKSFDKGSKSTETSSGPDRVSADNQAEDLKVIKDVASMTGSSFLPLIEYLYAKIQGKSPLMPAIPFNFQSRDTQELYIFAHNNLQKQAGRKKFEIDKNVL